MSDTNKPDPERDARERQFFTKLFAEAEKLELTEDDLAEIERWEMEQTKNLSNEDLEREPGIGVASLEAVPQSVEEILARVERKALELAKTRPESGEKK